MRNEPGVRRPRPRRCATCSAEATWATLEPKTIVTLRRDGSRVSSITQVRTYWCDQHVP